MYTLPYLIIDHVSCHFICSNAFCTCTVRADLATCTQYERACDSGICIREAFWCDGEFDCADKSDEKNCSKSVRDGMLNHVTGKEILQNKVLIFVTACQFSFLQSAIMLAITYAEDIMLSILKI